MTSRDSDLHEAAQRLIGMGTERGLRISCAESLTGGLVADALVSIPGASATFTAGIIAYTLDAKVRLLGIPADFLVENGPYNEATARLMAEGVARHSCTDFALATSGVAGPGPDGDILAGTVAVAVWSPQYVASKLLQLHGDRWEVRSAATLAVISLACETLNAR